TSTIFNKTVSCFGYGRTQRGVSPSSDPTATPPILPPYTKADLLVTEQPPKLTDKKKSIDKFLLTLNRNTITNQITAKGDSGGGCFLGPAGAQELVGVDKAEYNIENPQCRSSATCPFNANGVRSACIKDDPNATFGKCDSNDYQHALAQAAQSFVGFARAV